MSELLSIVTVPDERLRVVSEPVEKVDGAIKNLVHSMISTMYHANGIGLAAVQVGVPKRIIVLDVDSVEEDAVLNCPIALINPQIKKVNNKTCSIKEGCLSVPNEYVDVLRPSTVQVKYTDIDGKDCEIIANGMLARVIQHEYDHLEGRLLIDYLSYAEKLQILEKFDGEKKSRDRHF